MLTRNEMSVTYIWGVFGSSPDISSQLNTMRNSTLLLSLFVVVGITFFSISVIRSEQLLQQQTNQIPITSPPKPERIQGRIQSVNFDIRF